MARTMDSIAHRERNDQDNIRRDTRGLPAPLDFEVVREALCELDAGQRHFVLKCMDSFQVAILRWSLFNPVTEES